MSLTDGVIDLPTLSLQQDMDAACTIANTRGGNLTDTLPLRTIVTGVGTIKIRRLPQLNDGCGATYTDAIGTDQEVGQLAFTSRLHSFFG